MKGKNELLKFHLQSSLHQWQKGPIDCAASNWKPSKLSPDQVMAEGISLDTDGNELILAEFS